MEWVTFEQAAEQVKTSLNIVEVVSRFVPLKKRGRNHMGLCPFHQEKTPSFNVSEGKQIFKCFGCGAGGDALTFLMKVENKTYGELIHELADSLGLRIARPEAQTPEQAKALETRETLLQLHTLAAEFFESLLRSPELGAEGRRYFEQRGYSTPEHWQRYRLGYAAPEWDRLTTFLLQQVPALAQQPDLLEQSGLSIPRQNSSGFYDRFRQRVIIPILDAKGQVIAFGGRTLEADGKPKYMNSPESPLYNKSKVLYGLSVARTAIREHQRAVVMEGYFDVMAAQEAGILETVATCGTALTSDHVQVLSRLGVTTLYLAFDTDEAGVNATRNAIAVVKAAQAAKGAAQLTVRVLTLPDGKDPDDFFRHHGAEAFRQLLQSAPDATTFELRQALRPMALHTVEGQMEAVRAVVPILADLRHQPAALALHLRWVAQTIGLDEEVLRQEVQPLQGSRPKGPRLVSPVNASEATFLVQDPYTYSRPPSGSTQRRSAASRKPTFPVDNVLELRRHLPPPRLVRAEREAVALLLVCPASVAPLLPLVSAHPFHQPAVAQLVSVMLTLDPQLTPTDRLQQAMAAVLQEAELQNLLSECAFVGDQLLEMAQQAQGLSADDWQALQQYCQQGVNTRLALARQAQSRSALLQQNERLEQLEKTRHNRTLPGTDPWTEAAPPDVTQDLAATPRHDDDATIATEASLIALQYQLRDDWLASQWRRSAATTTTTIATTTEPE